MDKKTVYIKTAKGKSEGGNLSRDLNRLLGLIDNQSTSDELAKRAPPSLRKIWNDTIKELVAGGYIVGNNKPVVEQKVPLPEITPLKSSVSKPAVAPTEEVGGNNTHAMPAPNAAELAAKQKEEKSARARDELKAFFATAKVKADAEAKAAR